MDKQTLIEEIKRKNVWAIKHVSNDLRDDREVILMVVKRMGLTLKYASKTLRNDPEIVFEAAKETGWALEHASMSLRSNKDFLLKLIKEDIIHALIFASNELKNDKELVIETVKRNKWMIGYASDKLQKDRQVQMVRKYSEKCTKIFKHMLVIHRINTFYETFVKHKPILIL